MGMTLKPPGRLPSDEAILCSRCQRHLYCEFLNWEIERFRFAVTQPARPGTSHWIIPTEPSLSGEVALVVAHLRLEQGAGLKA
jgi:hypothetical protein